MQILNYLKALFKIVEVTRKSYFFPTGTMDSVSEFVCKIRLTFSPGNRDFRRGYFFGQWVHISSGSKAAVARLYTLRPENSSETENGQLNECRASNVERKHRQVRRLNVADPFIRAIIPDLKLPRLDRVALFVRNNETCKSDMIYRMTAINECTRYARCYMHDLIVTLIKPPSLSHMLAVLKLLFCSFFLLFHSYHDCAYDICSRCISFFLLLLLLFRLLSVDWNW